MFRSWIKPAVSAALFALLLMGCVFYTWPITDSYHPLNTRWNGCSQIYKMVDHPSLLYSYATSPPTPPSLLLIIGPRITFEPEASMWLRSFLEAGGIVVLADDYGTGNSLLEQLNVSVRFAGQPLADLYFYSKSPSFPIISHFTPDPLTRNLTSIVMNNPTYLEVLNPATVNVLALSSPFSFVDLFNNGSLPSTENTQSFPVIVTTHVGRGSLVLIANTYIFTNEMIGVLDNAALFRNLLEQTNGTATFDLVSLKTAPLTNYRITFRYDFDQWIGFIHSTITQVAVVAVLIVVYCAFFFRGNDIRRR